jgi:hypothetical protein
MEAPREQGEGRIDSRLGIGSSEPTKNPRLTDRQARFCGAEQPGEQGGAAVGNVKEEVALPRKLHEPGLGHCPGHHARPLRCQHRPLIEEAHRTIGLLGEAAKEHRRPLFVPLQRAERGRGDEGLAERGGIRSRSAHAARHAALKAMEIRGESAVEGCTKW